MNDRRALPVITDENRHFWTGGAEGVLRILRCGDCGHWQHPAQPLCSICLGLNVAPAPVSGKGVVWSYTINMRAWTPRLAKPYALAIVELVESKDLRMTSKIVNSDPEQVYIGMPVEVVFENDEDVWLPFFQPANGGQLGG
jgi:uncharacterized OB-fold protein